MTLMIELEDLRRIVGERVSASPSEQYCYSRDASLVEGKPDYIVRPKSAEEVQNKGLGVDRAERHALRAWP